jgi:voltage-gated sodium channel
MARMCARLVAHPAFDAFFLGVIIFNAVLLGAETYPAVREEYSAALNTLNDVCLGLFCVELAIRFCSYGSRPQDFFRNGWNVFDFIVIGGSFLPGLRENATLLRLLRLLRVVRAVRLLPDLRVLVVAVGRSIPGVASLAAMTLLLVYLYAMVGWVIFNDFDPENFGTIGRAMISMFVLLTLEGLPEFIEQGLEYSNWTVLFYVSYVLVASFLIFNLFIGVVINSLDEAREVLAEREVRDHPERAVPVETRLRAIRKAVDELELDLRARD